MSRPINRREWLAATTAACVPLVGCAARITGARPIAAPSVFNARRLSPVVATAERVIRTVGGLRPYRPSGFVVRAEKLGDKTLVHNYGHGGGGITLSWGTSHLAANLALSADTRDAAVIGAGAVGLATARLLTERGFKVTIYAKDVTPNTTSNIAGGQWFPATVYQDDRTTPEFRAQFLEAARFAYRRYQALPGDYYGIRWMPNYSLSKNAFSASGLTAHGGILGDLLPEGRELKPNEHHFPYKYVRQYDSMFIQPHIYLEAMMRELRIAGIRIEIKEFRDMREVGSLPHPVIVNCTGLGAKTLVGDNELIPIKGQLTVLLPQPEVEYAVLFGGLYMFPRRDGIILGGTHEEGNNDPTPDPTTALKILAGHAELFGKMAQAARR